MLVMDSHNLHVAMCITTKPKPVFKIVVSNDGLPSELCTLSGTKQAV